jgi:hypothetical protein
MQQREPGLIRILDPTGEARQADISLSPRTAVREGGVIGLLDNGKANADLFLEAVGQELRSLGYETHRVQKKEWPGPIGPAPDQVLDDLRRRCFAVVNAFGD